MTFNGSWGYFPAAVDWHSAREVVMMLRQVAAGGGNLLLNIGPQPDGSVPDEAFPRLTDVGRWLEGNGEAVYGEVDRVDGRMDRAQTGAWTLKGNTAYFWCHRWVGRELTIGGLKTKVERASFLATGKEIAFNQEPDRLILAGMPGTSPDDIVGVTVIKLEFEEPPAQKLVAV